LGLLYKIYRSVQEEAEKEEQAGAAETASGLQQYGSRPERALTVTLAELLAHPIGKSSSEGERKTESDDRSTFR